MPPPSPPCEMETNSPPVWGEEEDPIRREDRGAEPPVLAASLPPLTAHGGLPPIQHQEGGRELKAGAGRVAVQGGVHLREGPPVSAGATLGRLAGHPHSPDPCFPGCHAGRLPMSFTPRALPAPAPTPPKRPAGGLARAAPPEPGRGGGGWPGPAGCGPAAGSGGWSRGSRGPRR